jgi:GNAT superfamily N-acetyltransferase
MGVRPLDAGDASRLERFVLMAQFPPDKPLPHGARETPDVRRWLQGWPSSADIGVGCDEQRTLVGAAWARPVEPVLVRDSSGEPVPEVIVAVDRDQRGRGIGARLLTALAENAHRNGRQTLALTVSPRNPAGRLYRRLGYEAVGRTDRGLLVMRLDL